MPRRVEVHLVNAGCALFALDQGEGPPLVFFHGGLADHRAALVHVGALAERLRLITPDLRGAGRSAFAGPLDWGLLAGDLPPLLDHLGLARAAVGGVSMGAAVAARAALDHPERVAALALVHPVHPGADQPLAPEPRAAMAAIGAVGSRVLAEGIGALLPLYDALPDALRARARAMAEGFDPASVAATARLLASAAQPYPSAEALGAIRCPALVVPGIDPSHPAEVARRLAAHLPWATLHDGSDVAEAIARLVLAAG